MPRRLPRQQILGMLLFSVLFGLFSVAISMNLQVDNNQNLVTQVANICAEDISVDRMLERISNLEDFEAVPAIIHCKSVEVCKLLLKKSTTYTSANKKAWDLGVVIESINNAVYRRTMEDTPETKEKKRLCLCEIAASGWDALKPSEKDLSESNLFYALSMKSLTSLRKEFPVEFDVFSEATIKAIEFNKITEKTVDVSTFTKEYSRIFTVFMSLTHFTAQIFEKLLGPVLDIHHKFKGSNLNWLDTALLLDRPSLAYVAYKSGVRLSQNRNLPVVDIGGHQDTYDKFAELIATPLVMSKYATLVDSIKTDPRCNLFGMPAEICDLEMIPKLIAIEKDNIEKLKKSIISRLPDLPEYDDGCMSADEEMLQVDSD